MSIFGTILLVYDSLQIVQNYDTSFNFGVGMNIKAM